ncbi:DUF6678 family protein [Hymenobacter sp. HD11105]
MVVPQQAMLAEEVIDILTATFRIGTRAKLHHEPAPSAWSSWFLLPVPGYIEASTYGPVPRRDIEWIELNPVEQRYIGRLVPPHILDHTEAILEQLHAQGIRAQVREGLIRLFL